MKSTKQNSHRVDVARSVGLITATSIVVANMIGAGIFTTSGIMAANLPDSGWVMMCWLFGGLLALSGALCYAELATRMPEEGGEYFYLKKLYHPVFGFLTGWISFVVGFSVPIAASAYGFASYLSVGLGERILGIDMTDFELVKKAAAIVIIIIFTTIHYLGVRLGSRVQNGLTIMKVILVLGLASAGLALGGSHVNPISFQTGRPTEGLAVGTSMMLVMFAYSGWNASAYIAGELKEPRKTLPRSLLIGTLIVIFLFLAINLFIFRVAPYADLHGTITVVETAAVRAFGSWMGAGLSILIGAALLSSLSAFIMIGPRIYYAMARDRLFFPFAAKVHPQYRVPGKSIIIQGSLAGLMLIIGSYEQLLVYLGFSLSIFPWLAIAGLFIARKRGVGDKIAFRVWGYPIVPLFYLVSSLTLMVIAYINRPVESSVAVITVILGVPCYFLWVRKANKTSMS